jgi:hypothetical protein
LFQYPGAFIMTAVGVFAAKYLENPQGVLSGLTAGERGRSSRWIAIVIADRYAALGEVRGWRVEAFFSAAVLDR